MMQEDSKELLVKNKELTIPEHNEEAPIEEGHSAPVCFVRFLGLGWLLIPLLILEMDSSTRAVWDVMLYTWQGWLIVLIFLIPVLFLFRPVLKLLIQYLKNRNHT